MSQSASQASAGNLLDSYDFNQNYDYLKKLIQDLKVENGNSLKKELFGEDESSRTLTKKEMKQLFKFFRKIEAHYAQCSMAPIPDELEQSIRAKDAQDWLPWEKEAIEKVDIWKEAVLERRRTAGKMLDDVLDKVKRGESI